MNLFPPLRQTNHSALMGSLPVGFAPATTLGAFRCGCGSRDDQLETDTLRNHLIVAFSDQMATPQTCVYGTIEQAKRLGRKYANQHLPRAKHTHRHVIILDETTGKQTAFSIA